LVVKRFFFLVLAAAVLCGCLFGTAAGDDTVVSRPKCYDSLIHLGTDAARSLDKNPEFRLFLFKSPSGEYKFVPVITRPTWEA
jgi:hypothetical protein